MFWLATLKCRDCGNVEDEKQIDAESEEAAKLVAFDCNSCGRPGTLEVVPSTLRTRYLV